MRAHLRSVFWWSLVLSAGVLGLAAAPSLAAGSASESPPLLAGAAESGEGLAASEELCSAAAEEARLELTEEQVIACGSFARVTDDVEEEQTAASCRSRKVRRLVEGPWPFYFDLFAYFQRVSWCYTGDPSVPGEGRITSISRSRWAEVYYLGWDFVGHVDSWSSGGAGTWKAVRGTQGKFRYCPPKIGCIQTRTPWVEIAVFGNGRFGFTTGG
ncbi:MAG TPA: hypothetical protein VD704_10850 [Gaiellaceae bacterium]|nr:hypothetical protein [Gaiellaceae bacterium]